ncbi:MAG: hypothetical protein J3R72DRAFT_494078 [Linnemannia gamsii]|nr:MAG: hypothetical protein J3R72DRAFT_494078 [Linnemannia gamsii]
MPLNATIAPMLRQVNLIDEFVSLSKRVSFIQVTREDRTFDFAITGGFDLAMERYGGETRLISRPVLYDLFLRQVPKERIHLNTKILNVKQDENDVRIYCEDGSIIIGNILVGADGAHSTIRKNIYAQLKEKDRTIDTRGDPFLAEEECQFIRIVGDSKPYAGIKPTILRFVMRNMPEFMKQRAAEQMFRYRPQVAFLPLDDTQALFKPAPQHSLHICIERLKDQDDQSELAQTV